MKKIFVLFSVIALIAIVSCKDEKSVTPVDPKVIIGEIFKAGMSGYSQAQTVKSQVIKLQALKSSSPINLPVDYTALSPEGGNIHVTGSVTGSINFDANGNLLPSILLIGLTETVTDYAFTANGQKYTMNGAPYVSLTGTFTIEPDGTFGTASSMQMGGGFRVVGPNYDQTLNIHITINFNSTGTGGDVSGTIGGEPINYTF
jgi:hypothetical protein